MKPQVLTAARIEGWPYRYWWHIQQTFRLDPLEMAYLKEGTYRVVNDTILGWGMYTAEGEIVTANAILETPSTTKGAKHALARLDYEAELATETDISALGSFLISVRAQNWQRKPLLHLPIVTAEEIDYRDFIYLDRMAVSQHKGQISSYELDSICKQGYYVVTSRIDPIAIRNPQGEKVSADTIIADSLPAHPPSKLPRLFLIRLDKPEMPSEPLCLTHIHGFLETS